MKLLHKIGVVGDKDSILSFKALGIDVYPVVTKEEARSTIDEMASNDYGIIFVTEQIATLIENTIERYNREVLPAVILIPNNQGSLGIGLKKIDEYVEKAIGSNIF